MSERNFFSASGLTNTSANHIANLAKEYYEKLQDELENYKYEDIDVSYLDGHTSTRIQSGISVEEFNGIPKIIAKIAQCRALVAYLREAIKERQRLLSTIDCRINQEFPEIEKPSSQITYLSAEDVMATWSIGKLNKYYQLEAACVTLGKLIHKNGDFSKTRKDFSGKIRTSIQNNENNVLVYKYIPSISSIQMDSMFFSLQDSYRRAQAELNGIKQEIDDAIRKDTVEKDAKYDEQMMAYRSQMQAITAKKNVRRIEENERILALKIVIPDNLKGIYDEIKNLSR